MTHVSVGIIIPASTYNSFEGFVQVQMAPYDYDPDPDDSDTDPREGRWDYYSIGGAFDGWINNLQTTAEDVEDNLATSEQAIERRKIPFALITPDGDWHESDNVDWNKTSFDEDGDEAWDHKAIKILGEYPGHHLVIVDAHVCLLWYP